MQQQLPAAVAGHPCHRRWCRPDDQPAQLLAVGANVLRQQGRGCGRAAGGGPCQPQQAGSAEGHKGGRASLRQFLPQEGLVAPIHEMADHPVLWAVGLHQHLAGPFTPPGTPRQLQEQLQALLGGP